MSEVKLMKNKRFLARVICAKQKGPHDCLSAFKLYHYFPIDNA